MFLNQQIQHSSTSTEIAKSRLKTKIVKGNEVIDRLECRKSDIESLYSSISCEVDRSRTSFNSEIQRLEMDVDKKFNDVIVSLDSIFLERRQVFNQVIKCAKQIIESTLFLIENDSSSDVVEYSSSSQKLEDLMICCLILLDNESQTSIDNLPGTIRPLTFESVNIVLLNMETTVKSLQDSLDMMYSIIVEIMDECAANSDLALDHCLFSSGSSSQEENSLSISSPEVDVVGSDECRISIETDFTATVLSATSLTTFILQPCNEHFAFFSSKLSNYLSQLPQMPIDDHLQFLESLIVGSLCCVKHTNNCWYRAKVILKVDVQLVLLFMDYGYQLLVPLSADCLLPLPELFTNFPVQAFFSEIHGGSAVYRFFFTTIFMDLMYQWLVEVLCGSTVIARTQYIGQDNELSVQVFVPSSIFFSEKSLMLLNQFSLNVIDFLKEDETLVNLLEFLCNIEKAMFTCIVPKSECSMFPTSTDLREASAGDDDDNVCPSFRLSDVKTTDPVQLKLSDILDEENINSSCLSDASAPLMSNNELSSTLIDNKIVDDNAITCHGDCDIDGRLQGIQATVESSTIHTDIPTCEAVYEGKQCFFQEKVCKLSELFSDHSILSCSSLSQFDSLVLRQSSLEQNSIIIGLSKETSVTFFSLDETECYSDSAVTSYSLPASINDAFTYCSSVNMSNILQFLLEVFGFCLQKKHSQCSLFQNGLGISICKSKNEVHVPVQTYFVHFKDQPSPQFKMLSQTNNSLEASGCFSSSSDVLAKSDTLNLIDYPDSNSFVKDSNPLSLSGSIRIPCAHHTMIVPDELSFSLNDVILSKVSVSNAQLCYFIRHLSLPTVMHMPCSSFDNSHYKAVSCLKELQMLSKTSSPLTFSAPVFEKLDRVLSQCSDRFLFTSRMIQDVLSILAIQSKYSAGYSSISFGEVSCDSSEIHSISDKTSVVEVDKSPDTSPSKTIEDFVCETSDEDHMDEETCINELDLHLMHIEGVDDHLGLNHSTILEDQLKNQVHVHAHNSNEEFCRVTECEDASNERLSSSDNDSMVDSTDDSDLINQLINTCPDDVIEDADPEEDLFDLIPPPPDFCADVHTEVLPTSTPSCCMSPASSSSSLISTPDKGVNDTPCFYHSKAIEVDEESQFRLVISHVESPSLMYFFPVDQIGSSLLQLESRLYDFYNIESNCIPLTVDEVLTEKACCVQEMDNGVLCVYRGLCVSDATGSELICRVLCVDYGWTLEVPFTSIFKLDNQFFLAPVMVSACSLFGIFPLNNTNSTHVCADKCHVNDTKDKWSRTALDELSLAVLNKPLVGVLYETSSGSDLFPVHSILLYDTGGDEDIIINFSLVEKGYASSSSAVYNFGEAKDDLTNWDPMEMDYRSSQSMIKDMKSAVNQRMYDGPSLVYASPRVVTIPESCSWVFIIMTSVYSINRFVSVIVGSYQNGVVECLESYLDFLTLIKEMDNFYNKNCDSYELSSSPGRGETVCVWNESHDHWYRATVIKMHDEANVKVYLIDVGYEDVVSMDAMCSLCPQFCHVPAQAVECCLSDTSFPYKASMDNLDKGRKVVSVVATNKLLLAKITYRSSLLHMEVYQSHDSCKGREASHKVPQSLNAYLICKGYLVESPTGFQDDMARHNRSKKSTVIYTPG